MPFSLSVPMPAESGFLTDFHIKENKGFAETGLWTTDGLVLLVIGASQLFSLAFVAKSLTFF